MSPLADHSTASSKVRKWHGWGFLCLTSYGLSKFSDELLRGWEDNYDDSAGACGVGTKMEKRGNLRGEHNNGVAQWQRDVGRTNSVCTFLFILDCGPYSQGLSLSKPPPEPGLDINLAAY